MRTDVFGRKIMCATCEIFENCLDPERKTGRSDNSTPPSPSEEYYCEDWVDARGYGQDEEPEKQD